MDRHIKKEFILHHDGTVECISCGFNVRTDEGIGYWKYITNCPKCGEWIELLVEEHNSQMRLKV